MNIRYFLFAIVLSISATTALSMKTEVLPRKRSSRTRSRSGSLIENFRKLKKHEPQTSEESNTYKNTASNGNIERILCILKPNTVKDKKAVPIVAKLTRKEFNLINSRLSTQISKEEAENLYEESKGKEGFDEMVTEITSGPVHILVFKGKNAITKFALNLSCQEAYSSPDPKLVEKEIKYFFPDLNK